MEFKAGWTGVTRPSHLCGKVLNPARYAELCKGLAETAYFPAYRQSDFKRYALPCGASGGGVSRFALKFSERRLRSSYYATCLILSRSSVR